MKYEISKSDYYAVIDEALDFATASDAGKSATNHAMSALLAAIWDSSSKVNLLDALSILDAAAIGSALDLIIGRLQHGRPIDHLQHDRLERIYFEMCEIGDDR